MKIFFNVEDHIYTNERGEKYISTTTLISKYYEKFSVNELKIAECCERIGQNKYHEKYLKYKGKTAQQLLGEWADKSKKSSGKGTEKHLILEESIKKANGYDLYDFKLEDNELCTINHIMGCSGDSVGMVDVEILKETELATAYPEILGTIIKATEQGFKCFTEVCVYNNEYMVSGLIDLLLVRGTEFAIIDWKTNENPIVFEAGYYEKNNDGTANLEKFVYTNKFFFNPLSRLPDSVGNHYSLQLSIYDHLLECFGLKCLGNRIYQIQDDKVSRVKIPFLEKEVKLMIGHYTTKHVV